MTSLRYRYRFVEDVHCFDLIDHWRASDAEMAVITDWCVGYFGEPGSPEGPPWLVGDRWATTAIAVWFKDERDALEFRLRWC